MGELDGGSFGDVEGGHKRLSVCQALRLAIFLANFILKELAMIIVNVHEAKTNLSRLLAKVEAGEEVVIARSGTPVAPDSKRPKAGQAGIWLHEGPDKTRRQLL